MRGPGRRHAADGRAVAARAVVPGTIDVGGAGPGRARRSACATRRVERAARRARSRATRQAEILERARASTSRRRRRRPRRRRCPPFRRDDVTREADLIEEVARIDGLEKLPATLPARRGAAGRLDARAAAAPRAPSDALVGPRPATRSSAGASPSPACATGCACPPTTRAARRALENPMSRGPVGAAHDAARLAARRRAPQRRARRRATCALFEAGRRLPRRRDGRELPRRAPRARRRCSPARLRAADAGATPEPPRRDFFAAKGAARRRCSTRCACRWTVRARDRAVPAPGRSAARAAPAASAVGLARRAAPARRARVGPRAGRRALRARPRRVLGRGDAVPRYADLTTLPGAAPGPRGRGARRTSPPAQRRSRSCARRAARCCAGVERVRRLPRRAGGGGAHVARAAARVPRAPTAR